MPVLADANLDELKRKARRRLVGAVVLALAAAVFVPMLLESDERPLGDDVSVRIPPVDQGKFVNRLNSSTPGRGNASYAKEAPAKPLPTPKTDAVLAKAPEAETAGGNKEPVPLTRPAAAGDAGNGSTASAVSAPAKSLNDSEQRVLGTGVLRTPITAVATKADAVSPAGTKQATAAPSTTATPKAAAAIAVSPKPAHGGFVVQLAAFSDDKGANALANRLKRAGHPAFTEPVTTSRGRLWRVRVGPYASRDEANAARDKLKREGQIGIVAARSS